MGVIKSMFMRTLLFVLILAIISCIDKKGKEFNGKNDIINVIYKELRKDNYKNIKIPPPPNGQESVGSFDDTIVGKNLLNINKQSKKSLVAIFPELREIKYKMNENGCAKKININSLNKVKGGKLKIDQILAKENDSIIFFNKDLYEKNSKDFYKFDVLIGFSSIMYNSTQTKAAIIGSINFSKLSGVSTIYFLEKTNDTWKIICKEGIAIS